MSPARSDDEEEDADAAGLVEDVRVRRVEVVRG